MKNCKLYLNHAGYCYAKANHAVKGAKNTNIKFHALFGLIMHPDFGWIIFDTGYTERFYKETKFFPNKIYALATKVHIIANEEIKEQLNTLGINAQDIKHVVISHFHADHIGGLKDFTNATIYCSKTAYQEAKNTPSLLAFSKGILKGLIPDDIENRLKFIEDFAIKKEDEIFSFRYDLFNDDSIYVYNLPGHAAGQIGILLKTEKNSYFLIADACWDKKAYLDLALPHPIVKLFFNSWRDYKESVFKIRQFHFKYPEVKIVPTHCSDTTLNLISQKVNLDAL
jgi:glyoxylase-like metal-dependent hydrolase (beta-lactamase superfamily II)